MAGRSREYDIAFRLNGIMDPSIRRSIGDSERHIQELERAIRELSSTGGFDSLRRDASRTGTAFDSLQERAESFGDTLNRVAEFTGAKALIDAATGSIQNIVGTIGDQSEAMAQLQASTGMTAEEMREMDTIAKDLYSQPLGEGFDDIASAMATVKQATGLTGEELENTTKNAMVFRDVFAADVPESLKVVDTMMRKFGITSDQAYNLLAQGQQKGLNKADDLMDTINEYSVYFDTMGYSADQMFDTLAAGMENGAFNADKVGDAVKEFGIRIKDGSKSTYAAMATLFAPEGVGKFVDELRKGSTKSAAYLEIVKRTSKTTADSLVKDLNKGGTRAEEAITLIESMLGGGNKIVDDLGNGAIKGKDAMEKVIAKLREIKDPIEQNQIAVALFGTQFEDLEAETILAMGSARNQFDMTKETMEEVAEVKYDTLMNQFKEIGRGLMVDVVIPIGEDLMPTLQSVADWMADNKELLKVIALGVPAAMLVKNTVKIVKSLGSIGSAAGGAVGTAGKFARIIGGLGSPLGLATTGIGLLTTGILAYKKHQEEARSELLNMGDALETAYSNYEEVDHANKRTQNLINEYDRLTGKINDANTPANELTEARRKLKKVEEELIGMNQEILSAEDAKTGRFRDQLEVVKDIHQTRFNTGKRELEHEVLEAENKFPDLERNTIEIEQELKKQNQAYAEAADAYGKYVYLMNEHESFMRSDADTDAKLQKNEEMIQKINAATGNSFIRWDEVDIAFDKIEASFDKTDEKIKTLEGELNDAQASMESYYNNNVKMIEMELGGSIDELAAKYKNASAEEKEKIEKSIGLIAELNDKVNLLPAEKKINIDVFYKEIGKPTYAKALNDPDADDLKGFKRYADGGFSDRPAIFGEAGLEAAIPINDKPRSHAILDAVNQMMGHDNVFPAEESEQWRNLYKMQAADLSMASAPFVQPELPALPTINFPDVDFPQLTRSAPIQQAAQRNELLTAAAGPQMQQDNSVNIEYAPQVLIQGGGDPATEERFKAILQSHKEEIVRMLRDHERQQRRVDMRQ